MEPAKLALPAGLVRGAQTDYATPGRYRDARFMRWDVNNDVSILKPMKGWVNSWGAMGALTGVPRVAHAWLDNAEVPFCAFGTSSRLQFSNGTTLSNITPTGFVAGGVDTSTWTMDSFGELLVAVNDSDRVLYEYDPNGGGLATVVTGAPSMLATFVTGERFVFGLGINGDARSYGWADQETLTEWTATSINQAGDLPITEVGNLMCGSKIKGGALLWTTNGVHYVEYIGRPSVYGGESISQGCGIISRNAFVTRGHEAFWMGNGTFYTYRGYVESMQCEISDYVFAGLNATHAGKIWAFENLDNDEIWFVYPRDAATECSHAAIYNHKGKYWNHTEFSRSAGFDNSTFGYSICANSAGRLNKHETGWAYDDTAGGTDPRPPYITSGSIELGNGDRRLQVDEVIPDEVNSGEVSVYFLTKEKPNGLVTEHGPYTATEEAGVYTTARLAAVRYEATVGTEDFRVGTWRARVKPRGRY